MKDEIRMKLFNQLMLESGFASDSLIEKRKAAFTSQQWFMNRSCELAQEFGFDGREAQSVAADVIEAIDASVRAGALKTEAA
jgi:hypothetical protein